MIPYAPRSIQLVDPIRHNGWELKRYAVRYGSGSVDHERFASGREIALGELPSPAANSQRIGAGFLIEHQGNGADYLILCWWDRENEMPIRVFLRSDDEHTGWRPARGGESVCVWDLQILWGERQAYVATVLAGTTPDRDGYLRADARTYLPADV